jgi:hypothetical protein
MLYPRSNSTRVSGLVIEYRMSSFTMMTAPRRRWLRCCGQAQKLLCWTGSCRSPIFSRSIDLLLFDCVDLLLLLLSPHYSTI